jgi:hypothetical protein
MALAEREAVAARVTLISPRTPDVPPFCDSSNFCHPSNTGNRGNLGIKVMSSGFSGVYTVDVIGSSPVGPTS